MKIKTLAMIVVSALSLSSTAALADTTTVNGGTVHFKGEVVNAACAVDAGSFWPCKTLPLAAQPTSACRSSTIPVRHWHWTAPPSVLRPR